MKAALHALDQLNTLAWQQSVAEGSDALSPPDKHQQNDMQKANSLDELQRSLSMPDQISADLTRPLMVSSVDEVSHLLYRQRDSKCDFFLADSVVEYCLQ